MMNATNECPRQWALHRPEQPLPQYDLAAYHTEHLHLQLLRLWRQMLERRLHAYHSRSEAQALAALERWCKQQCRIACDIPPLAALSKATEVQLQHCIQQLSRWLARLGV